MDSVGIVNAGGFRYWVACYSRITWVFWERQETKMTWPCFYCTYENEDDSTTLCCICGMPGNRIKKKAALKNTSDNDNGENSKTTGTASMAIDLTSPDDSANAFSSKRKRKNPPYGVGTNENGEGTNSISDSNNSKRVIQRNLNSSLARRKPPQRPKLPQKDASSQRQSTISFPSISQPASSHFSHGHIFGHKVMPLDDPIRRNYHPKMERVLKSVFGLESLRPNLQPAAIKCAMEGKSQMIVMATGGGKSLCYQLPACLLGGVTVVISPLLALMKDQTEALQSKGIPANCINSSQTEKQNKAILEKVVPALYPVSSKGKRAKSSEGTKPSPPAVLLYVTPESIQTERMRAVLKTLYKEDRLALFAVDEAHCLSTWVS